MEKIGDKRGVAKTKGVNGWVHLIFQDDRWPGNNGIDLSEKSWLTLDAYCAQWDIVKYNVLKWIRNGVIPDTDVIVVKELDGLMLIRNVQHGTGRARGVGKKHKTEIVQMFESGVGASKIAKRFGCSRHAVYSIVRREKQNKEL